MMICCMLAAVAASAHVSNYVRRDRCAAQTDIKTIDQRVKRALQQAPALQSYSQSWIQDLVQTFCLSFTRRHT